ncbi:cytochrome P450 family protein [Medicago truncatula]|uniref:Cytochrome P450 family protein n=1 Tax=Medicago truncatula TaxID=3880 RepID=A0A072UPQ6_MEDTR|nr:cytochrome P450 family protein [Medicago truncatula]
MRKVQEELEIVVGKDNLVEESHIQKLPYLQAVMKETLRLHPTLPLLVPHCPTTLVHLFDWTVPQGENMDVSEKFGIVLKKKTPLLAIPTTRLSNPDLYN